ncbi:MAG: glycosyltransferase [Candidatus Nanoarchaeia archaeon]|nr:glycosyltransferase [Candidatus Nanoarchaeia archaeon]
MKLSIIIPTLNEEENILKLLISIKKQSFKDYEIIVADNNSEDKTKSIAKKFKTKIVAGGLPPKARNNGARVARGEYLLFLDADVILSNNFLNDVINEFEKRKLDIATTYVEPITNNFSIKIQHSIYNFWMFLMQKIDPHAPGFCILTKKSIFEKVNGFDETIKLAEDHAYMRKAFRNKAKYGILKSKKILVSVRRFNTEGKIKLIIKYFLAMLHRIFIGEIKSDVFKYGFKHK